MLSNAMRRMEEERAEIPVSVDEWHGVVDAVQIDERTIESARAGFREIMLRLTSLQGSIQESMALRGGHRTDLDELDRLIARARELVGHMTPAQLILPIGKPVLNVENDRNGRAA